MKHLQVYQRVILLFQLKQKIVLSTGQNGDILSLTGNNADGAAIFTIRWFSNR